MAEVDDTRWTMHSVELEQRRRIRSITLAIEPIEIGCARLDAGHRGYMVALRVALGELDPSASIEHDLDPLDSRSPDSKRAALVGEQGRAEPRDG
jgi:hypothetical protein